MEAIPTTALSSERIGILNKKIKANDSSKKHIEYFCI